jgi:chromosome segregation ATPase
MLDEMQKLGMSLETIALVGSAGTSSSSCGVTEADTTSLSGVERMILATMDEIACLGEEIKSTTQRVKLVEAKVSAMESEIRDNEEQLRVAMQLNSCPDSLKQQINLDKKIDRLREERLQLVLKDQGLQTNMRFLLQEKSQLRAEVDRLRQVQSAVLKRSSVPGTFARAFAHRIHARALFF